jgi:SAM-dependent methyltransferase
VEVSQGIAQQDGNDERQGGPAEDWNNEEYVAYWLEQQNERSAERDRHFAIIRALIPRTPEQEFRYLNLGAGPGRLDEILLTHFPGASATLIDGSLALLSVARQQLDQFADRVEYVQANLANPDWAGAVSGPFDFAISTIAIHHLRDPQRIRELYAETYRLLGHGGMFLNLDYVRPSRRSLGPLAAWAVRDPDAGVTAHNDGAGMPGTLLEQLGWLNEAGFGCVEVFWKEMNLALVCGIRDHLHMPEGHAAEDAHTNPR